MTWQLFYTHRGQLVNLKVLCYLMETCCLMH